MPSHLAVWMISALLHAVIFLPFGRFEAAGLFGSVFVVMGLVSTTAIYFGKVRAKHKQRS